MEEKKHGNPIAFLKWVASMYDENGNYINLTGVRWHFSDKDDTDNVSEEDLWELYKMHHPEIEQPQPGAAWVKASLFKYVQGAAYHAKDTLSKGAGKFDIYGQFIWGDGSVTLPRDFEGLLILDEGTPTLPLTRERADFIREANNRDLGGTAAAEREEDAILFSEWCASNYQRDFEPLDSKVPIGKRKYRQFWIDNDQREFTTAQLYELFKQKEK